MSQFLLMGKVSKQSMAYLYNCPDEEEFEVIKRLLKLSKEV